MPVVGEEGGAVVCGDPDVGRARDVPVRPRRHVGGSGQAPVLAAGCTAEAGSIGHRTPFTLVTANAAITAIMTAPMYRAAKFSPVGEPMRVAKNPKTGTRMPGSR
jgi:hypothetical protein